MSIVSTNDINKYFSFGFTSVFYKIIRITAKTVFYKRCISDNHLDVNNGILWVNFDKITYIHYSTNTEEESSKILIRNMAGITLYDDITDLYFKNNEIKDTYTESTFYLSTNVLKNAGKLRYFLFSLSKAEEKIGIDERASQIFQDFLNSAKLFFNLPNIEHILTIIKTELFEDYYRDEDIARLNASIEKYILIENIKNLTLHENVDCPVCLNTKDTHSGHYECNHLICGECFESWDKIKKSCPICRSF
jgi:hypothetical protein